MVLTRIEYFPNGGADPTQVRYEAAYEGTVPAAKHFAVGMYPPQTLWIDDTVPTGKVWKIRVLVYAEESDA